eukprot:1286537-Amphidinium_carterae.1
MAASSMLRRSCLKRLVVAQTIGPADHSNNSNDHKQTNKQSRSLNKASRTLVRMVRLRLVFKKFRHKRGKLSLEALLRACLLWLHQIPYCITTR